MRPLFAGLVLFCGCAAPEAAAPPCNPLAVIVKAFEEGVPGNPYAPPFRENAVVRATAREIVWRPLQSPAAPLRALRFAEIESIAFHVEEELPSRPEAIFIYRKGDGWLAGPAFVLRRRPTGTYRRLREALAALGYAF